MKTAGREIPNRWVTTPSNRAHGAERSEQTLLKQVGCEATKTPALGVVFFLDFYLYRTCQDLTSKSDMVSERMK